MPDAERATLTVEGVEVACHVDGSTVTDRRLSPRPFLHPVRTLGGTEVTDCMPDDHRWHLGLSVALQDVGGVNFWGGRTYVRQKGYVWRDDHGVQEHHAWQVLEPDSCTEEVGWYAPDGRCLLAEERSFRAAPCEVAGEPAWMLSVDFGLRNVSGAPLELGSPATNGRAGAGYGGLFWRLPRSASPPRVFTAEATGETAVHGSVTPWIAWTSELVSLSATYRAERHQNEGPAGSGTFTVALAAWPAQTSGRTDPWFVRVEGYPGMCSALAFAQPALLAADGVLARHFDALIADVALDPTLVAAWVDRLAGSRR
ncbi:MAG: PmoA family protein [Acidimicrobiales bacterium]